MKRYFSLFVCISAKTFFAQPVPIEALHNSCGSGYFIVNESNQPAMLVRGFFCGNSYIYTPVGMGDSIKELYFALAPPFPPTNELTTTNKENCFQLAFNPMLGLEVS